MAYSHSRLRNTLAFVRVVTGVLFLVGGGLKISSWDFARNEFPQFVWDAIRGTAVGFYGEFLTSVAVQHLSRAAAVVAFTELTIGVGLLLGLAVRPVSLLGMFYSVNLMLATWNLPPGTGLNARYMDNLIKLILMLFMFLVFAIGHAGENWGLGSLYHRRRRARWERLGVDLRQEADAKKTADFSRRYLEETDAYRRQAGLRAGYD